MMWTWREVCKTGHSFYKYLLAPSWMFSLLYFLFASKSGKADFYAHVEATMPQERSSCWRIREYVERSFPSMHTASFLGDLTSGRCSRDRCEICLESLLPMHEECKCKECFLQSRLAGEICSSDMHKREPFSLCWLINGVKLINIWLNN